MAFPVGDGTFDHHCEFGAMFFPDKPRRFAEAHHVLERRTPAVRPPTTSNSDAFRRDRIHRAQADRYQRDRRASSHACPHGCPRCPTPMSGPAGRGFDAGLDHDPSAWRLTPASARVAAVALCRARPCARRSSRDPPGPATIATDVYHGSTDQGDRPWVVTGASPARWSWPSRSESTPPSRRVCGMWNGTLATERDGRSSRSTLRCTTGRALALERGALRRGLLQ